MHTGHHSPRLSHLFWLVRRWSLRHFASTFRWPQVFSVRIRGSAAKVVHPKWPRTKPLFFVSVDVKRCFDSVKQDKLFEIISKALKEEEYAVRRFTTVIASDSKLRRKFHREVGSADDELSQFLDFVKRVEDRFRNVIFGDQAVFNYEEREELLGVRFFYLGGNSMLLKVFATFLLHSL